MLLYVTYSVFCETNLSYTLQKVVLFNILPDFVITSMVWKMPFQSWQQLLFYTYMWVIGKPGNKRWQTVQSRLQLLPILQQQATRP